MESRIPAPNPFLTHWLLSGDCARVLRETAQLAADLFSQVVARRSGALAESVQVMNPVVGGAKNDRLTIEVVSGIGTPRGGYGAAHEYGIGIHPQSTGKGWIPQQPTDDWATVLGILASLP